MQTVAVRSELVGWSDELGVSRVEFGRAVVRLRARSAATGRGGIPGRAFALALEAWCDRVRRLFHSCLRTGRFPACWKRASVLLIPKPGKPPNSPKSYRPIRMLDEAGKLFKRVLAVRLRGHLMDVGADLSVSLFGFLQCRSPIDAVTRVHTLSVAAVDGAG